MRKAEKLDFVPRFVPRFALRYPHQSGQTAIGLSPTTWTSCAQVDDKLVLLFLDDDKVVLFDLRAVVAFFWWGDVLLLTGLIQAPTGCGAGLFSVKCWRHKKNAIGVAKMVFSANIPFTS